MIGNNYEEVLKAFRYCTSDDYTFCNNCPLTGRCGDSDIAISIAADVIEELLKQIERIKPSAEKWNTLEIMYRDAHNKAWEECYGKDGTQIYKGNPDVKMFKDE